MVASANAMGVRRFTRDEYARMAESGILQPDERVELIDGEIVVVSAMGTRHTTVLRLIARALEGAFANAHDVRQQSPLALGEFDEPEPDVAVVVGTPDDYLSEHPTTAVLVVEVADTSLARDRKKAKLYAEAKIPEYWIANPNEGVLEVRRKPRRTAKGWTYAELKRLKPSSTVEPLGAPGAKLEVSALLR